MSPGTYTLAAFLFADAAAMTPNLFLGVVIGVLGAWLRWRSPWRAK